MLRIGRINEIFLDEERKTLLLPSDFRTLSLNEVFFVGGYNHARLPYLRNIISLSSNYTGCLKIKHINNRDPVVHNKKSTGHKSATSLGKITFGCSKKTELTFGFKKPSSKLSINILQHMNKTSSRFSMSLRTFNLNGKIFHANTRSCILKMLLRNGRLFMAVTSNSENLILANVESKLSINDGKWHDVSFIMTQKEISLLVDKEPALTDSLSKNNHCFPLFQTILLGGKSRYNREGFVGCIRKLVVDQYTIQMEGNEEYVVRKGNIDQQCTLIDKCYPNPCRNNGICSQHWAGYKCDCSKTAFYGKNCDQSIYRSSCSAYQQLGLDETSYCLVDTDGTGENPPYTILCQFDLTRQAYTTIHHNKEKEFSATDGEETFQHYTFHKFEYDVDMNKIEDLIRRSKSCRQKVIFRCYKSALTNGPHGPPNVSWKSRSGNVHSYWGGVVESGEGCRCGLNNSCLQRQKLCNCDSLSNEWSEDSGYLTEKNKLPLTRLNVAGIRDNLGYFTIGPLECSGSKNEKVLNEVGRPADLLKRVCISAKEKVELIENANNTKIKVSKIQPRQPEILKTTEKLSSNDSTTTRINNTEFKQKPPLKSTSDDNSLSALEVVLISVAVIAVFILVIKFVFCRIFHKLHGQLILNHEIDMTKDDPSSLSNMGTLKDKPKSPLKPYWV